MKKKPVLIVMLTHNDRTVENAGEIFEQCGDSAARYWGMKEEGPSSGRDEGTLCGYETAR